MDARWTVVIGAAAALGAAGCNEIAGIDEGTLATTGATDTTSTTNGTSTTDSTGTTSDTPTGTASCSVQTASACDACLHDACADTYCECAAITECGALQGCIQDGGPDPPPSWFELCWQEHPSAIATLGSLQACGSEACPTCGLPPVDPCVACEYDRCAQEINDCLGTGKCTAYIACRAGCAGDTECQTSCAAEQPDGMALFQALAKCGSELCPDVCSGDGP